MNTTTQDVRDYLCKALAELADCDATPETMALNIERAKATSNVAAQYTNLVRVEIDAVRIMEQSGMLPGSVSTPVRAPDRPRLVGAKG